MVYVNRLSMPLQLVRYQAPGVYWVRGLPQSFLAQLVKHKLNTIER